MSWQIVDSSLLVRTSKEQCLSGKAASESKTDSTEMKIFAADLDGTLIKSKVGDVNPTSWSFYSSKVQPVLAHYCKQGWHLVIFSNQKNLLLSQARLASFMQRVENIITALGLPVDVYVATKDDKYRKPSADMFLQYLKTRAPAGSKSYIGYYVGDAAGSGASRPEFRWSDSDLKFAQNTKLAFVTPDQAFE